MRDPIHVQKVRHLQSQGMEQCGIVMSQPNNDKPHAYDVAIVSGAAVRWMPRDEFWRLMHPPQDDAPNAADDEVGRVARALCEDCSLDWETSMQDAWRRNARAAIAAMKEPSEAALRAEIESINLRHNARVSELLAANNAEVEKRRTAERWAAFGRAVMKQHKDGDCGDVDGEWLQGIGVQTGVLQIVEAKEPCAEEGCMCAATCGDWPVDCYRVVTP